MVAKQRLIDSSKKTLAEPTKYFQPEVLTPLDSNSRIRDCTDAETVHTNQITNVKFFGKVVLVFYLLTLITPIVFNFSSFTFTISRAFLTVICIPVVFGALAKRKISSCDVAILGYVLWAAVCFFVNHGFSRGIEPAGSHFVEVAASYFLARLIFDSPAYYQFWAKCLFTIVAILLPFALLEAVSGRPVILDLLSKFVPVYRNVEMPTRLGFDRAQTVFEHPILYGIFCANAFSASLLVFSSLKSNSWRILRAGIVSAGTFLSFATGAYLSVIWQTLIMAWNYLLRNFPHRWLLFVALAGLSYVFVDTLSNRTPFEVFITYFTFDLNSAYTRVLIWKFGIKEVYRHPLTGIGLNDWVRAPWMGPSVDNFWLLRAMRFGFPGILFLLFAVFAAAKHLTRRVDSRVEDWRLVSSAQMCTLVGTAVSLVTVDLWSGSQTLFFFSVGAIVALNGAFESFQKKSFWIN